MHIVPNERTSILALVTFDAPGRGPLVIRAVSFIRHACQCPRIITGFDYRSATVGKCAPDFPPVLGNVVHPNRRILSLFYPFVDLSRESRELRVSRGEILVFCFLS